MSLFSELTTISHTRDKVVFVDEFLGFNIYLHDRGQFWPGLEMGEFNGSIASTFNSKESLPMGNWPWECIYTKGRVGLSYAKFLPRDTEWEGSFEVIWLFILAWKPMPKLLHRCGRRPCLTRRTLLALRWFLFLACFEFRIPTTPSNPASSTGWPERQAAT